MAKRKLTLTIDEHIIDRAHAYSEAHGTSVSELVSAYLDSLARARERTRTSYTPTVQRLLGILPATTRLEDYHRHLHEKYGRPDE
jgi:hypothetical protein